MYSIKGSPQSKVVSLKGCLPSKVMSAIKGRAPSMIFFNLRSTKKFPVQINYGLIKVLVKKIKKKLVIGQKKFAPQNFRSKQIIASKHFWCQKKCISKLLNTKIWVQKNVGSTKLFGQK